MTTNIPTESTIYGLPLHKITAIHTYLQIAVSMTVDLDMVLNECPSDSFEVRLSSGCIDFPGSSSEAGLLLSLRLLLLRSKTMFSMTSGIVDTNESATDTTAYTPHVFRHTGLQHERPDAKPRPYKRVRQDPDTPPSASGQRPVVEKPLAYNVLDDGCESESDNVAYGVYANPDPKTGFTGMYRLPTQQQICQDGPVVDTHRPVRVRCTGCIVPDSDDDSSVVDLLTDSFTDLSTDNVTHLSPAQVWLNSSGQDEKFVALYKTYLPTDCIEMIIDPLTNFQIQTAAFLLFRPLLPFTKFPGGIIDWDKAGVGDFVPWGSENIDLPSAVKEQLDILLDNLPCLPVYSESHADALGRTAKPDGKLGYGNATFRTRDQSLRL
jgi:hypothetical protein